MKRGRELRLLTRAGETAHAVWGEQETQEMTGCLPAGGYTEGPEDRWYRTRDVSKGMRRRDAPAAGGQGTGHRTCTTEVGRVLASCGRGVAEEGPDHPSKRGLVTGLRCCTRYP